MAHTPGFNGPNMTWKPDTKLHSIATHFFAARQSLQLALDRLKKQERLARHEHVSDLLQRIAVAGQAGDVVTLISDQVALVPGSRRRWRATFNNLRVIPADLLTEWRLITQGLGRDLAGKPASEISSDHRV